MDSKEGFQFGIFDATFKTNKNIRLPTITNVNKLKFAEDQRCVLKWCNSLYLNLIKYDPCLLNYAMSNL